MRLKNSDVSYDRWYGAISVEAARAERFLNSRAKNPADALCTREEGACPEKEAERTWNGDREELSGKGGAGEGRR